MSGIKKLKKGEVVLMRHWLDFSFYVSSSGRLPGQVKDLYKHTRWANMIEKSLKLRAVK